MAQIGYIESLLGNVSDLPTKLAIRRVAEELLGRIATLEAATGIVPDTPGPGGPSTPSGHHETHEPGGTDELENAAWTDKPNVFTENQDVSKVTPEIRIYHPGDLAKGRILQAVAGGRLDFTYNLRFDPVIGWLRDDIAKTGQSVLLNENGFAYRAAAAGANPAGLGTVLSVSPLGRAVIAQGASTYGLELQSPGHVGLLFNETGQPVDGRKWRLHGAGGIFYIEPLNDAENAITGPRTLTLTRVGDATFGRNMLVNGIFQNTSYIYPGRADNGQAQGSWVLASHGSYGLYTNTGFYIAGPIYGVPWTSYAVQWTSTGTQPVLGNGGIGGYYQRVGDSVHFKISVYMGSTTTYGTGAYRLSLPLPVNATAAAWLWPCVGYDSSTGLWWAGVAQQDQAQAFLLRAGATSLNNWSPTAPVTWASGDQWHVNGTYWI